MPFDRLEVRAGIGASLPLLLGVAPFGLIVGAAMVASGIPPLEATLFSAFVYAGASQLAASQLIAGGAPLGLILLTVFVINLRFVMYSASARLHMGSLPRRWRLLVAFLLADNPYTVSIARFTQHPEMTGKLWFYLGASVPVWLTWQASSIVGALMGARLPAQWQLEFAAPLAFIAMSVPLLRDRAMVAAALASGIAVIVAHPLPMRLGLVVAALAGITAGMLAERARA